MAHPGRFYLAAVMGWPVMHSRSPMLHNHWFAEHGLAGEMENGIESIDIRRFTRNKEPGSCVPRMTTEWHDVPTPCRSELPGPTADEAGCPGDTQAHGQNVRCNQR